MMTVTANTDSELSTNVLGVSNPATHEYLIVANSFTASVYCRVIGTHQWVLAGSGELGTETINAICPGRNKGSLYLFETDEADPAIVDVSSTTNTQTTKANLIQWQKDAIKLTSGRGSEPNSKARHEVGCAAGWRCQFEGCGEDLLAHTLPGVTGNFSYYAHIIASSAEGPRGDKVQSPLRATDPTNLMLLCDKCHRLIDRVAPNNYPADLLFDMRSNNIRQVKNLLEKLKFKGAQMIAVTQPIQGQGGGFDERLAEEAMWQSELRKSSRDCLHFMQTGNISGSNQTAYWLNLFHALKNDLPALKRRVDGTDGNSGRPDHIALFPLHSTSVLVVTGRILGEASSISQFQFTRDQVSGNEGGQWAWPSKVRPDDSKFVLNTLKSPGSDETEALLLVYLTAKIPATQLPAPFHQNGQMLMPTLEVTIENPSRSAIAHPYDLELLGRSLDRAYAKIQDEWHVGKVHLIVIAPTTACVRVGQKMQSRNQSEFVLYERDTDQIFKPTVAITNTSLIHPATGETIDIS